MPENYSSPSGGAQSPKDLKTPKPMAPAKNPFASGFAPNGKRNKQGGFATKRGLLRHMLEVDLRIIDLPVAMADRMRAEWPGLFDNVNKKFTMSQIMELTQLQLLFSKSDIVRQHAINAIKERTLGKVPQKVTFEGGEEENPTQLKLPNGLTIDI